MIQVGSKYNMSPLKESRSKAGDGTTEAKVGVMCFKDGEAASRSWKSQENDSFLQATEGTYPADALSLALQDSFWTSDLSKRKGIKLYCFKPLV